MTRSNIRAVASGVIVAAVMGLAAHHGASTREALGLAVDLWWTHLVPVLLPGYVLARALLALSPRPPLLGLMALAFCTLPPVAALVLWDWFWREPRARTALTPLLLYTNLYNPLFFPDPLVGVALDAAQLAFAVIVWPPGRLRVPLLPAQTLRARQWIVDGMNWTSIVGLITVAAWIGHTWFAPLKVGWAIDPLGLAWQSVPVPSLSVLFWTALGGLGYWAPFFGALGHDAVRPALWRLGQALTASLMVYAAMGLTH